MEVTNSNFEELLPQIKNSIENSTFLAIDCEFSGLNLVSEINAYDTPKQYYEKVKKNSKDFLVIQYGISAFRHVPQDDSFKQQTYNFYIFRRPINRNIPDQRFLCQTSSIHFLITQGFDFNKLFKSGISYLNLAEEAKYRENIQSKEKMRSVAEQSNRDIIPVPEENQTFINTVVQQLDDFIKGDDAELELPKCNAFVRRLIYQTVAQNYKNQITVQTKQMQNKDRILIATRFKSQKDVDEQLQKAIEDEKILLDNFIGFTKVLRLIVDSGKLIVGHNMYLDFLHTIDKFLTPLPDDYAEFKQCAKTLFSKVIDTKYMASSDTFKDLIPSTILNDMLGSVSQSPFEWPSVGIEKDGQGYTIEDAKEHEAGYDAYLTGLSFLSMWNYLGAKKGGGKSTFKNFKLLQPYINKVFLMVLRDVQYINLDGPDPSPSRDHVFYLTFPKEWKLSNIVELFSPFGNVHVSWVSENSAYVALYKRDEACVALSTLSQSDTYSIMTYAKRQYELNVSTTPARRKRLSSDSFSKSGTNKKIKSDSDMSGISSILTPSLEKAGFGKSKLFTETNTWD